MGKLDELKKDDEGRGYRLGDIRAVATRLEQVAPNCYLAIVVDGEGIGVEYGLYSFIVCDASDDISSDDAFYECVFRGWGSGEGLREMRHTYFNPDDGDGYCFYLPIDATIKALQILKDYFDD